MDTFSVKPRMKDPHLYENNNNNQKRDVREVLEEYSSKIKWKDEAKVLDVGCGDGSVTVHVLKPFLPQNFQRLIGFDISPEMIMHANSNHKSERINFVVSDVTASGINVLGQFDHIFSFYVLHWVQEQEKALQNIHALLSTGGDCLVVFLCHAPILFELYKIMSQQLMWKEYLYDVEKYMSPYFDIERPEEEFSRLLKKCGFTHVEVERKKKTCEYQGIDHLKKALRAVNPFIHRLSPLLQEQFMEEYMEIARNRNMFIIKEDGDCEETCTSVWLNYAQVIAYAVK